MELGRGRVATGFLELMGYQAMDSGRPGWAQAFYKRTLVLTAELRDRPYGGYLVAVNLGHLALHCDDPGTALHWAQAAISAVGSTASPATRAAIVAVSARAHARLGDEQQATRLLVEAESLLNASDSDDEPPWISYFTQAYLADEMAHCLHDLGRAPAARTQVADAVEGVGRDRVRRLWVVESVPVGEEVQAPVWAPRRLNDGLVIAAGNQLARALGPARTELGDVESAWLSPMASDRHPARDMRAGRLAPAGLP
ncbi:hypothetical protein [Kitasatospora griseola]|uniref:hypothetical protein n=1 Tax=Kitasatospora griseola TaxID=2064 RepID=UPI0034202D7B